jgi:hypothetical protein
MVTRTCERNSIKTLVVTLAFFKFMQLMKWCFVFFHAKRRMYKMFVL